MRGSDQKMEVSETYYIRDMHNASRSSHAKWWVKGRPEPTYDLIKASKYTAEEVEKLIPSGSRSEQPWPASRVEKAMITSVAIADLES